MRCVLRHIQALLIAIVSVAAASAQQAPEPADTVAAAEPDTVAVPPPPPATAIPSVPKAKSTAVDIDREAPVAPPLHFYDAIMMVAGQERGSFDIWADCSIHNWFFPVLEAGIGFAGAHPDDGRCHFKMKPSPYVRVGINYNFLYKSNPDYQFHIGLRAGWSSFRYDIFDIMPGSQYYISGGPANVAGLSSTAFYGQALAGLKVKIWRGIFMGWSVRYNFGIHQSYSDDRYPAWFTPGKGTGSAIAATFSIGYTFGTRPASPSGLTEGLEKSD